MGCSMTPVPMSRLLDDILVVSVEQAVAAPFATRHLADLGARVIKVERPIDGDFARAYDSTVNGMASHFVWLNRSKESLTLDLKHRRRRRCSNVLFRGPTCSCRISHPAPRTGWPRGRRSSRTISVADRVRNLRIRPHRPVSRQEGLRPADPKRGGRVVDYRHAGDAVQGRHLDRRYRRRHVCLFRHSTALLRRERTGDGSLLQVSMLEALGEWMGYPAYYTGYSGKAPARTGSTCGDRAVWAVSKRRRGDDLSGRAERARMAAVLRHRPRSAGPRRR